MAGTAVTGAGDMAAKLAPGTDTVVAPSAIPSHDTVIHQRRSGETFGGMTNIALIDGTDMADGLADGQDIIVTGNAVPGSAFEHPVRVAAFTIKITMLTGELKAGGGMIKFGSVGRVHGTPCRK